ncbi:hypothetical protein DFH09DRAFT_1109176 [Mycena vulgaris]|nr:hypothetical protein DFH09DRAFT_1109176 [Mycena vulgaris]
MFQRPIHSATAGVMSLATFLLLLYISALSGSSTMPYWIVFIVVEALWILAVGISKLEPAADASQMYTLAITFFVALSVVGTIQPIPLENVAVAARTLLISLVGGTAVGYLALIVIVCAILVRNEPADLGSLGERIEGSLERLQSFPAFGSCVLIARAQSPEANHRKPAMPVPLEPTLTVFKERGTSDETVGLVTSADPGPCSNSSPGLAENPKRAALPSKNIEIGFEHSVTMHTPSTRLRARLTRGKFY